MRQNHCQRKMLTIPYVFDLGMKIVHIHSNVRNSLGKFVTVYVERLQVFVHLRHFLWIKVAKKPVARSYDQLSPIHCLAVISGSTVHI